LPQPGVALVSVTWTLTYEMFFYAIFATLIMDRRIGLALLLLWQAATAAVALSGTDLGFSGYYLRSLCLDFGIGLLCAFWVRKSDRAMHPTTAFALLAVGIAGFAAGMALDRTLSWAGVLCGLSGGAIILALTRLEQRQKLPVPELFMWLGG